MWTRMYSELLVMSAVAGGLSLLFKAAGKWIGQHLTANGHYGIWLMVYSFFLVPYHRPIPPLGMRQTADGTGIGQAAAAPTMENIRTGVDLSAEQFLRADLWPDVHRATAFPWPAFLPWLHLSGTLVFIGLIIAQYIKLHRHIMRACRPADQAELLDTLEACKRQLGIKKHISVYLSPYITTPFLFGWVRSRIVLPDMAFTAEDWRNVLLHELTHYKRRDPWVKLAMLLINAIHWFNPFAYMARRETDRFCEFACDEKVVKPMDVQERRRYCELILRVMQKAVDQKAGMYSAFGGRKNDLERRILMILNVPSNRKKRWVKAIALGMTLTMALFAASIAYAAVPVEDRNLDKLPATYGPEHANPVTKANSETQPALRNHATVNGLGIDHSVSKLENSADQQFLTAIPDNGLHAANPAVSESDGISAAQAGDFEPMTSGSLSPGKAYTFDKQSIGKGSIVTINASWTPTDANLQVGLLYHGNNTVYYVTLTGGEGSVSLQVNATGDYSIYVVNPSNSTVKFEVSYLVN